MVEPLYKSKNSIFNPFGNSEKGKGWLVKSMFFGDSRIALTFGSLIITFSILKSKNIPLLGNQKTIDRIQYLLLNNKPLRN